MTETRSYYGSDGADNVRQLTSEEKDYAARYLNETDENREYAIAEIKRWIREADDLCARTDDFFILRFLRTCKFNIENTKLRMRNYYQLRVNFPELYMNKNPFLPEMQTMLNLGVLLPLQKLDRQGRIVVLARPALYDPYKQSLSDFMKATVMMLEVVNRDHVPASLHGTATVTDLKGATFGHALQIRLSLLKHLVHLWHNCYPVRVKSINFINVPAHIKFILTIFKQFMSRKMKERVHIYRNISNTNWYETMGIPADILPIEYGGTDGTVQDIIEYWKKKTEENRDWLIDDEKYTVISSVK